MTFGIEGAAFVIGTTKGIVKVLIKYLDDKDRVGEFLIRDNNYREWEVKVRRTSSRGRYLKLESKTAGIKFKASADGYKPEKYVRITPSEWGDFAAYALGEQNYQYRVKSILSRLAS